MQGRLAPLYKGRATMAYDGQLSVRSAEWQSLGWWPAVRLIAVQNRHSLAHHRPQRRGALVLAAAADVCPCHSGWFCVCNIVHLYRHMWVYVTVGGGCHFSVLFNCQSRIVCRNSHCFCMIEGPAHPSFRMRHQKTTTLTLLHVRSPQECTTYMHRIACIVQVADTYVHTVLATYRSINIYEHLSAPLTDYPSGLPCALPVLLLSLLDNSTGMS